MQTNNYAIIENTIIVNATVADFEYAQSRGWVKLTEGFGIGDFFIDGQFVKAPQPQPTPQEIQAQNKSQASTLLQETDWVELGDVANPANPPYLSNKSAFTSYRAALRSIAVNPPTTPAVFPAKPDEVWSS